MALPQLDIFSTEQVAKRWGVKADDVDQLIRERELAEAFIFSGPARLRLGDTIHPEPRLDPMRLQLLVSAQRTMPDKWRWPLSQVRRIFAVAGAGLGRISLAQYCQYETARKLGWAAEFEVEQSLQIGSEKTWVAYEDLRNYETAHGINKPQGTSSSRRAAPSPPRDTRKPRCQVAAELLWRGNPELTLAAVYQHAWVQDIACEKQPPPLTLFESCVKHLDPKRNAASQTSR